MPGAAKGTTIAPPFAHTKIAGELSDGLISVILKGMKGPVSGKKYDAQMLAMENNDDAWIAAVASYIRNSFGNAAPIVSLEDVARVRAAIKDHNAPWTQEELQMAMPQILTGNANWKLNASHNAKSAQRAIDGDIKTRFDTATPQVPGMWFEIELPEVTTIAGLRLNAGDSVNDYPRGYKVELSDDGKNWSPPVAQGKGRHPITDIFFPPGQGRFIRITQTGSVDGLFWSIHELAIYTPGMVNKIAPAKSESSKFE